MRHNSFALRCRWILRALGRNPLVRSSDRFEAMAVLMVFAVAVMSIPVAMQAGENAYHARMSLIDQQLRTRHSVEAVVISTATSTAATAPSRYRPPGPVRVQWREGNEVRTENVPAPATVRKGDSVTAWLDSTGKVVAAPDTQQVARSVAAGRTWTVWMATVAMSMLITYGCRKGLDRLRAGSWERELQLLSRNDDGWANRHT